MPPGNQRRAHVGLTAVGMLITGGMIALSLLRPAFLATLDAKIYDAYLKMLPRGPGIDSVVVVDIDEESLARYGQWPWPRYRLALLLEKIRGLGAASAGLDMIFAETDRTSLSRIREELRRDLAVEIELGEDAARNLDNDRALAEELRRGPYVLSYEFSFRLLDGTGDRCTPHSLNLGLLEKGTAGETSLYRAADIICNIPLLSESAPASGFFNAATDRDGVLRRVPLVIEYGGRYYPSLALATLMLAEGAEQAVLERTTWGDHLVLGEKRVPLDQMGNMLLRFRGGAGTFRSVPAADILLGKVQPGDLNGKIVFVGTSAAGFNEARTTSLGMMQTGAEIHATVIDNILSGEFMSRPRSARALELLAVLAAGCLAAVIFVHLRAGWGFVVFSLLGAVLWFAARWLLSARGVFFSPLMPLMTVFLSYSFLESLKLWEEEKKVKERTREFSRAQEAIILSMASLAETRDDETGKHILRTQQFVRVLAEELRKKRNFGEALDEDMVEILYQVAPLHDVGKVGVSDTILLKPGRLTQEEYEEMKKHTTHASETIKAAEHHLGGNRYLCTALEVAETHQEWWDGRGYPRGLKGEEIPIAGRIMAVADVYDALISRRRYKTAVGHEEAVKILLQQRGTHFDPCILDAFLAVQDKFREIARRFSEEEISHSEG